MQVARGRHSGRVSPCEREPESSNRRGSFLREVQPRRGLSQTSGRRDHANKQSGVYWIPALAPKRRSAETTIHGFDSVISTRVLRLASERAKSLRRPAVLGACFVGRGDGKQQRFIERPSQ